MSWVPDTFPNPDTLISELGIGSPADIDVGAIAEYCGVEHSAMTALLRIVPDAEYQAWLLEE